MTTWTSKQARSRPFIPLMRELVRAYQDFERFAVEDLRERGLTSPQADVIFALGNTDGMTCKELGERSLITKGTLTGIIDRLEKKGLVLRTTSPSDRRSVIVELTPAGIELFEQEFPAHIAVLEQRFGSLPEGRREDLRELLVELRGHLQGA
ncbi:MAG: MarR family transcriptional regulator [Acidobacteria bacterium]|nr:MAG: MarR family transcriptional regulator [Acidobacteriota bacterium]REK09603.1 MAG: MarR family transcriptional regulator [Acidobacteriota bacterium]